MAIPGLLLLHFCLFNTYSWQFIVNKICQWLDSNCRPLVLEATALPIEPQPPLPHCVLLLLEKVNNSWMVQLLHFWPTTPSCKWTVSTFTLIKVVSTAAVVLTSVTIKKSPNVYKSCPKWFHKKNLRFWHLYKKYISSKPFLIYCPKLIYFPTFKLLPFINQSCSK